MALPGAVSKPFSALCHAKQWLWCLPAGALSPYTEFVDTKAREVAVDVSTP